MKLYDYQIKALKRMGEVGNGCVLCGGVGSGKSITALSYYYLMNGGDPRFLEGDDNWCVMDDIEIKDLYIITTARKRDTFEWEHEMTPFLISPGKNSLMYQHTVVVDSWNNLHKYTDVKNAFFIFDEQRVVGRGSWVKSFLKIAKNNQWILLSATPGDNWSGYIPLFIAHGFVKNRSQFERDHVIFSAYAKFPKIERYVGEKKLRQYRDSILVDMDFRRPTVPHHIDIRVGYDVVAYKNLIRTRFDPWKKQPMENAADMCYCLRRVCNDDERRINEVYRIALFAPKVIIFYSFDYELERLKNTEWPDGTVVAEWNGHKHEPIPDSDRWIYLVNYAAGAEGWKCTDTYTIIFYSQHYSYKMMVQSAGRIDRVNTPFHDLYFYHIKSSSPIDLAIGRALKDKKTFNESRFVKW